MKLSDSFAGNGMQFALCTSAAECFCSVNFPESKNNSFISMLKAALYVSSTAKSSLECENGCT